MPRTGMTAQEMRDRVIEVALNRIRKDGFRRVRLTDVAQDLGVSHAALYAHFADKMDVLDAVLERWVGLTDDKLEAVCAGRQEPIAKIYEWFLTAYHLKRERALNDPEVYEAFDVAQTMQKPFVIAHFATARRQLADLLSEAAFDGETAEPQVELLLQAMIGFQHPKLVAEQAGEDRTQQLVDLLDVVLAGLRLAEAGKGSGPVQQARAV